MAQESCDLDNKEEAELLKPPSSSSSPGHPQSSSSSSPSSSTALLFMNPVQEFTAKRPEKKEKIVEQAKGTAVRFAKNRCTSCKRKVGLTGFRCRCGDLFCGQHRYSDTHDCSFDYKAFGREQIAKANPVIRAAKIIKI